MYVTNYHGTFVRLLYSVFVQSPMDIWFRWLSRLLPSRSVDNEFMPEWQQAQQHLATSAFPATAGSSGPNHPPDPRALSVKPENVTVIPVPDTPISDLVKIDSLWGKVKDPSGAILLLTGIEYQTCHAFTRPWARARESMPPRVRFQKF